MTLGTARPLTSIQEKITLLCPGIPDGLIDSETVKSSRLGQRRNVIQKTRWKNYKLNVMHIQYGDVPTCNNQADDASWNKGRQANRKVYEDMDVYRETSGVAQSQKPVCLSKNNPSQHQWEYGPSAIATHTHTSCSTSVQAADAEVLVITTLMVWWLISPSHTLWVCERYNHLEPWRLWIPPEISYDWFDIIIHTHTHLALIFTYKLLWQT